MMDAGVPTSEHVAGISTGLVSKSDDDGNISKYVILTDIIGAEDHFGDMDFKVCGTRKGVTGFQLDLKIHGLPFSIAKEAVIQVTKARHEILDVMEAALPSHRKDLREHAPQIEVIEIDPEKIGALIGPGGKNIRRITEVTGANIDIDDDNSGKVRVYAKDREAMKRAKDEIDVVTGEIEAGKIYRGIVRGVKDFGAFVECLPGKEGLVHISELADFRVNRTEDICKLGDEIIVKCIGIDERGRVKLSRRAAMEEQQQSAEKEEEAAPATEATDNAEAEDAPEETAEQSGDDAATEETSSDAGAEDSAEEATEEAAEATAEEASTDDSIEEATDDSDEEATDDSDEEATADSDEEATADSEEEATDEETNKES